MLSLNQITALAKIGKLKIRYCDGIPISVGRIADYPVKYPYELFKEEMGLEDLRLQWMLGENSIVAGGSVLNWVWGESKNEDIDFFFKNIEATETFITFIESIGFKNTMDSNYAKTYFEPLQQVILQVVIVSDLMRALPATLVTPEEIIRNFDFHLCKFAVDAKYVYTSSRAIQDLLKLTLDTTGFEKQFIQQRLIKYIRKGFFPSPKVAKRIKYDK